MLAAAADALPVEWLLRHASTEPLVVQSFVSADFAAYARVFNPANGFDGAPVRWSRIAREKGIELTAETRWSELAVGLLDDGELINLDAPDWSPDPRMAQALTSTLEPHTVTPENCYFLVWEGYAGVDDYFTGVSAPKIAVNRHRSLFLLSGSLQDACAPFLSGDQRLPNWWWPRGREWCVGSEIYSRSVFVGGTQGCIAAVLSHPDLEALPISPDSPVQEELE